MTTPQLDQQVDSGHQHVEVRRGAYADSVTLLGVSKQVAGTSGVASAQVAMATPLNLDVLASMGFEIPEETTPNEMIVAIRLEDGGDLEMALSAVEEALARSARAPDASTTEAPARTTRRAFAESGADLALVSVPGQHALVEAVDALDAERDVMIFSDNVPLEHEIAMKDLAAERGLLVMGPDCGTAMVGGIGLGFANRTAPGPVGIVAASGTGCQQLMCLLDHADVGVGAALGVGGRDLGAEVAGRSTREALRRLDADPSIAVIVVVSKPPAEEVAARVRAFAAELSTPVHFALLGAGQPDLTQATEQVLEALGRPGPTWPSWGSPATDPANPATDPSTPGGFLRGLFVGGTLCDEAMLIASADLGEVHSNIPLSPELALDPTLTGPAGPHHTMVDFGDDSLTEGRAHPMIDPTLRLDHLARAATDPETACVLLDVVLGHGAEADPAASLAPAVRQAIDTARSGGRTLPVVVACVGTESDPQQLTRQAEALAAAGAEVHLSNARAARRAISLTGGPR